MVTPVTTLYNCSEQKASQNVQPTNVKLVSLTY